MSEIANYLRLMIPSNREIKQSSMTVYGDRAQFTSALTTGYKRRGFAIQNNESSNKMYIGDSTVTATDGFPIAAGATLEFGVTVDIDPYFVCASGETCDARIIEIA